VKLGASLTIATPDGVREYMPTRWRGVARALDLDGSEYMIRRWRSTKAAAENATRDAGMRRLADLARARAEAQSAENADAQGDLETTVADLVDQYLASPRFARLASKPGRTTDVPPTESILMRSVGGYLGMSTFDQTWECGQS
jgi:hypothetical protein